MIVLRFTGGLGNQMFQYALYRYLKRKYPEHKIKADISWYAWNDAHQGFELTRLFKREDNPAFTLDEASIGEVFRAGGKLPQKNEFIRYINRAVRAFAGKHFEEQHIYEDGHEHSHEELRERIDNIPAGSNAYITGYFLDEVYYKDSLDELRKALSFDIRSIGDRNRELLEEIGSGSSVSIHIRRGDYLSPVYSGTFRSLSGEYYEKAIEYIKARVDDPKFYIFSDDGDYAGKAFNELEKKQVITWNTGSNSYIDMLLMSRCRYNITANSTFSEWAGLLNPYPEAVIVYPKEYMTDKDSEIKTLPGWVRI